MCYLEAKTGTVPYTLSTELYPSSSFLPRDKLRERDRIGASRSRLTPRVCLPKKHHSKYFREMEVLLKVLWEEGRDGDSAPLTETLHSQRDTSFLSPPASPRTGEKLCRKILREIMLRKSAKFSYSLPPQSGCVVLLLLE